MKKIIVSPAWFPNKETPSAGDFIQLHAKLIAQKNQVVVCFAWSTTNQDSHFLLDIQDSEGLTVVICYYKKSSSRVVNLFKYFIAHKKAIHKGLSLLKGVDIFHVNVLTKPAIWPYFYYFFKGIPYFITEHSSYHLRVHANSFLHLFRRLVQSFLISRAKGISAVSKTLKQALLRKGFRNENFKVIPNLIDSDLFDYDSEFPKTDKTVRFLHVSNLDDKPKNIKGIVNAFEKASLKCEDVELHIVGGYKENINKVKLHLAQIESKAKIFFYGILDRERLKQVYNQCDYFVMFSNYETQSIVTLEALMCGLPVIATRIPALLEFLNKENSVLVNPKDESALTDSIVKCASAQVNFDDRKTIAAKIRQRYNNELLSSKFEDFFGFKI